MTRKILCIPSTCKLSVRSVQRHLFLLLPLLLCYCRPSEEPKPNLVFILADDLNKTDLSCYGGENVETPHIDQLAREGMRFEHIFTASAMCAPTRMQLYTGLHPVRSGGYPNHSRVKPDVKSVVQYLEPHGYRSGISGKWHIKPQEIFAFDNIEPSLTKEAYLDYMTADDQPFALFVCSKEPHVPWDKGDPSVFDPDEIKVPEYLVDNAETRQGLCRYYAEVKYLDNQVKEVLEALKESGKAGNTVVMFATEQGAQWPGCKWTCYDPGLAAGLIVKYPPIIAPGSYSKAMINYIDVVPTFLEIIGAKIPDVDGRSFLKILKQETEVHNNYVYGIHTQKGAIGAPEKGYPIRSIRSPEFLYIKNLRPEITYSNSVTVRDKEKYWNSWIRDSSLHQQNAFLTTRYLKRPPIELYRVADDPYQLTNLAGQPEYQSVISDLDRELLQWMDRQGDQGEATEDAAPSRIPRRKNKN